MSVLAQSSLEARRIKPVASDALQELFFLIFSMPAKTEPH
jgi:hypothetical protein